MAECAKLPADSAGADELGRELGAAQSKRERRGAIGMALRRGVGAVKDAKAEEIIAEECSSAQEAALLPAHHRSIVARILAKYLKPRLSLRETAFIAAALQACHSQHDLGS